jgi:hypothetical protein
MRYMIGFSSVALSGCGSFDEGLRERDLTGVVRIPVEALTALELVDPDGTPIVQDGFTLDEEGTPVMDITDQLGLIGPVYIGGFPSVEEGDYDYPHPEMGPILDEDRPGNTYPYGGTTIGRFDYACYKQLACKVVTGRYDSFQSIIDFFSGVVQEPIIAPDGTEVLSGATYQEHCFSTEYVTSDDELSFVDDNPNEDVSPYFKPYFRLNGEGTHYEADVTIPQALFIEDMELWGWVDMPSARYNFTTCDSDAGTQYRRYTEQFMEGSSYPDLLNYPGIYIDEGDWVAEPVVLSDADEKFTVDFNFQFEG